MSLRQYLLTLTLLPLLLTAQDWQLVWSDEFDGNALDAANWTHERGNGFVNGLFGWGNGELQYYQEQNTSVGNGMLTIEAREEPGGIADEFSDFIPYYYSSSRIITRDKFEFLYGRVEARMKTVDGQGMWPAFWMLPGGCWPETGEIDIMEQWGNDGNTSVTTGAAHLGYCGSGSTYVAGSNTKPNGSYADGFHVYAVEWYENYIAWYVDDILFHSITPASYPPGSPWPFNQNDWFIIFNLAITSSGPNANTVFPNQIQVDYVRVYENTSSNFNLDLEVDVSNLNLSPTDIVYVNGTFNDWCGVCTPMTDLGNDIWNVSLDLPPGEYEYKFTVNGWDISETLTSGTPCTKTTGEFVNRVVQLNSSLSLGPVCWEQCDPCSSDITFRVDMSEYPGPFNDVFLSGTFNGWCGNCNQLIDPDADGVYETTVNLAPGLQEYKFNLDNWAQGESFASGEPCTMTTDIFVNRFITVDQDALLPTVCWNSCSACPATACQTPTDLEVVEIGFGGTNPRVNATWTNPEGTTDCELRGGRINASTIGSGTPAFANVNNTRIVSQTNGSTINFNIALFNNPNIPFVSGQTYGYEVRCQCQDGSGYSEWSGIGPNALFTVPPSPSIDSEGTWKRKNTATDGVQVFPNPSEGQFTLRPVAGGVWPAQLILRDVTGKTVYQERMESDQGDILIDVAFLEAGIYLLEWTDVEHRLSTQIIIR